VPLIPYFLGLPILFTIIIINICCFGIIGYRISNNYFSKPIYKEKIVEMIFFGFGSAEITFIIGRATSILFGLNILFHKYIYILFSVIYFCYNMMVI